MYKWKNSSNTNMKFIGKLTELLRLLIEGFFFKEKETT